MYVVGLWTSTCSHYEEYYLAQNVWSSAYYLQITHPHPLYISLQDTIKNPTVTYNQGVHQLVVELGSVYHEVTHTNTILLEQSQGHSLSYLRLVLCCQLFDHRLVAGLWKEVCYWLSIHCISLTCVAFYPGLVTAQFLIACSKQNGEGRPTVITWGITLSIHLERGPECNNLSFPFSMSWTTSEINATLWLQALGWRLYKKAINPLLGLLPR